MTKSDKDLKVLDAVIIELAFAQGKFPPFHSAHVGYAFILEEVEELWAEVRSKQSTPGRDERMRKEAIQIAAMAIRFVIDMPSMKN